MDSHSPARGAAERPLNIARIRRVLILAGVYLVAGKLGLSLAFVHPSATAVWAPTGIALAALLVWGYSVWPGVFLGAYLVNVMTYGPWYTSLGIATGNTLEVVIAAYLVTRFAGGRHAFERPLDVFKFAGLAGLASTTVSATLGPISLALGGYATWSEYGTIWVTWWLGNASGAVLVAPALVLWSERRRAHWYRARAVEGALVVAAFGITGAAVFGGWVPRPYPFMCIPPLVWIAFRFGTRLTATAVVALAGLALAGAVQGLGPFQELAPQHSLLVTQAFLGVIGLTVMTLAAAVHEHAHIERLLRQSEEKHRAIAALTTDFAAVSRLGPGGTVILESVTDGFTLVTGYTHTELEERGGWPTLIHPDDGAVGGKVIGALMAGRNATGDVRIVTKSGDVRWMRYFSTLFVDSGDGGSTSFLTAAQDITARKQSDADMIKQEEVIRVLSTPVLRLRDRLLILPVIGDVDPARARQLTTQLIQGIRTHRAKAVVLDLTGVAEIEQAAAGDLVKTVETARLMGATTILSGVSTAIAQRLVDVGIDLATLRTAGDLQAGLDEAQRLVDAPAPTRSPAGRSEPARERSRSGPAPRDPSATSGTPPAGPPRRR